MPFLGDTRKRNTSLHIREFKLRVLTANGKRQNVADSAYFFSNQ